MKLRDASGKVVEEVTSDVPDLVTISGSLNDSEAAQKGASLQVRFRRGQQFKGEPAFTWHINCEKGEIRLVSPSGSAINATSYSEPVTIDVHDFAGDNVRREQWEWPEWQGEADLPFASRSIARLYEAFHEDAVEGRPKDYPDIPEALKRHQQLSSLLAGWTAD